MHTIQEKILKLSKEHNLAKMTLRQIGRLVGEPHPQKIQHHLNQLEKHGLILRDEKNIKHVKRGRIKNSNLIAVPILGMADCGQPVTLANEVFEGFLQVSNKLLKKREDIFAIRAQGDSMNKAKIGSEKLNIEEGDYVLVDSSQRDNIQHGDYALVAVDEVAAIKRVAIEKDKIILVSESTADYSPIFLHPDDKYVINGKIIQVIKRPKADWVFGE